MKLRKIIWVLGLNIVVSSVYAQKGVQIGANFTPGLSYMFSQNTYYLAENSKELDYKAKFSFNTMFQVGYNFKENHGFQFYVGYCREGQNYKDDFKWKKWPELVGTHEKHVNFDFANFGFLYRWSPVLPGQKEKNPNGNYGDGRYKIRMKLLAGVETDFLLKATMTYQITHTDGSKNGTTEQVGYPILPANGGFVSYTPNPDAPDYKSYFKSVQAALVIKYGFDFVFKPNMYLGIAFEGKAGLNDINAAPYRVHPDYKKSKNYFFGLNVELGYIFQKAYLDAKREKKKAERNKDELIDVNKEVDKLDKRTKKKIKKTRY